MPFDVFSLIFFWTPSLLIILPAVAVLMFRKLFLEDIWGEARVVIMLLGVNTFFLLLLYIYFTFFYLLRVTGLGFRGMDIFFIYIPVIGLASELTLFPYTVREGFN